MSSRDPLYRAARYGDASAQESGLAGWHQTYCQLKPGAYEGGLETLTLPGVAISRERINVPVHQLTAPPPGQVVFVQEQRDRAVWRLNGATVGPGSFSVICNGEEQAVAFSDASDVLIVAVEAPQLAEDGDAAAPSYSAPASDAFNFFAAWVLSVLAQFAMMEGVAAGELATVLPGMVVDRLQYVSAKAKRERERIAGRPPHALELFRKASRIAEEEVGEGLSVGELARRSGVPPEILRRAFLETVGLGPGQWLRSRRLDGARRDLMRAAETGQTVTEIAARWGFFHFGRFSATYSQFFGEAPSRTVRGSRTLAVRPSRAD